MGAFDQLVVRGLPLVPRRIVQRVGRRYVAGEVLAEAANVVRALNEEGALATVDFLGEDVRQASQVDGVVQEYLRLLDRIHAERLHSNVSVKLSALGLKSDAQSCREQLARIAGCARRFDNFVRIDMEDHSYTDDTLRIFDELEPRWGNLGVVLQAMLRRTPHDIETLLPRRVNVRLCKGIYREPAELAYQDESEVRDAFARCLRRLLEGKCYVGIATHDDLCVQAAEQTVRLLGLAPDRYEFQLLLGVRPSLRRRLIAAGHRVRVYVPYGADWYAYSCRRLRENPKVARHIIRAWVLRR